MAKDCIIEKRGKKTDLTKRDCNIIKEALESYAIYGVSATANRYIMEDSPTKSLYDKTIGAIADRLRKSPDQNFLIIFCYAGHNMQKNGKHIFLFNEFDESTKFYKVIDVEDNVRNFAQLYKNSY